MSHYTKISTCFKDTTFLLQALHDLGFAHLEAHETPQNMYGYQGDMRPDTANVIVRRQYISTSSNDIGFKRNADGVYEANISEYDRVQLKYNEQWLGKLTQRYAYHATVHNLTRQGFKVSAEQQDAANGKITLKLQRRSW